MLEDFGFGDFVFRRPDGSEVGRAEWPEDARGAAGDRAGRVARVPRRRATTSRAGSRRARTSTSPTRCARGRPEDFGSTAAMRAHLIAAIADYRREQTQLFVADFDRDSFDFSSDFYRIGGGSLGGKARGLAFVRRLLAERGLGRRFSGVSIGVPAAVVLGTDIFDRFLGRERAAPLRDRVRGRRGAVPSLRCGALSGGGRERSLGLSRASPLPAGRAFVVAARGLGSRSRSPASTTP